MTNSPVRAERYVIDSTGTSNRLFAAKDRIEAALYVARRASGPDADCPAIPIMSRFVYLSVVNQSVSKPMCLPCAEQRFEVLQPVSLARRFVPPDAVDAGKSHGDAGAMPARPVETLERDL